MAPLHCALMHTYIYNQTDNTALIDVVSDDIWEEHDAFQGSNVARHIPRHFLLFYFYFVVKYIKSDDIPGQLRARYQSSDHMSELSGPQRTDA